MRAGPAERRSRAALAAAAVAWGSAAGGRWWGGWALIGLAVGGLVLVLVGRGHRMAWMLVLLALAAWWSGHASALREQAILDYPTPPGPVELEVRLLDDPRPGRYGWWAPGVADPPEPGRPASVPMLISFEAEPPGWAGDVVAVDGWRSDRAGRAGGDPYSGSVRAYRTRLARSSGSWWWWAGNMVRGRALGRLRDRGPGRALLAGFLVGDTTQVPAADLEAMRRTGLTHLVAVSGSNVALFLMLILVASGPLAAGPRRRAAVGLAALVVLVVATRWEPSVVRASTMAGLVLAGRVGGWALDPATALATTVVILVVGAGQLATDVGFTLSVLATLGVIFGTGLRAVWLPRPVATTLGATIGAQAAVAPVILTVFGSMPLMAPVTNLVAVPVVAVTTVVGAIGVAVGWEPLIELAVVGADLVILLARLGAPWPQIAWPGVLALAAIGLVASRAKARPFLAVVGGLVVAHLLVGGSADLVPPAAVVLDVGQGDAILVVTGEGNAMLVDGGPDPAVLEGKLASYGVTALDLVVLTHVHADHATGLEAVLGRRPVGEIWLPEPPHTTPASSRIADTVEALGIPSGSAPVGKVLAWDDLLIEVLGPVRRYASPNDQSVVMRITGPGGRRLLLTGDIEVHAQGDLAGVEADVLKVPHQGGATSDLEWLAQVGAEQAVISVGPNDFGHPAPEVVDALAQAGAKMTRTDEVGDVVIDLGSRR